MERGDGHAAEVVFEAFLKLSEILKSITILPIEVSVPKDSISLKRTRLDTVKIMKSIANPTENSGNCNFDRRFTRKIEASPR